MAFEPTELITLADRLEELSQSYADERTKSADRLTTLDVLLAANLTRLQQYKRNAGIDQLRLMLVSEDETAKEVFEEYREAESKYKGLERLISAVQEKINVRKIIIKADGGIHG
jgi:hypothetical protein